jgi:antitoxin component of RelBE/YafQ-DinJ toxin-antitoxin module
MENDIRLNIRITEELRKKLTADAAAMGLTVTDYVKLLITNYKLELNIKEKDGK